MDNTRRNTLWLQEQLQEFGDEGRRFDESMRLRGIKLSSRVNKINRLLQIRNTAGKPLGQLTDEEIRHVMLKRQEQLGENTYRIAAIDLRDFYQTVYSRKINLEIPRAAGSRLPTVLKSDEIKKFCEEIPDLRDRTIVKLLYETGCRPSEIATLRLKQIVFDEISGYIIVQDTKTREGARRIRFYAVTPDLKALINQHPNRNNPEAELLFSHRNGQESVTPKAVWGIVDRWSRRILGKPINPKTFRHSRFTHLSGRLSDRILKQLGGWRTTKMLEVYSHLSGEEVDSAVLGIYGVKPEEVKPALEIITCKRCGVKNNPAAIYCQNCGDPLIMQTILRDKEMQKRDEMIRDLAEKFEHATKRLEDLERRLKERS